MMYISGLGPSSEAWFENLTSEHEQHRREIVPANRQTGWSPCPSGGVLIVSGTYIIYFFGSAFLLVT